ncbi:MAG TPA: hypothetical protein VL096_01895 [Pirellulaceae bacterium]|nr:hypothetical protein [Pirellulaceae bacterium]
MDLPSRRDFLAAVGQGMIVSSLGIALAHDCGLATAWAADDNDKALTFGALEPLVDWLQATGPEQLLPQAVEKLRAGLDLKQLTAAASLANARTFGGEHYGGFHTFMALAPAYQMSQELPKDEQALPILKVLYRNATFMRSVGAPQHEVLQQQVHASSDANETSLRDAINRGDKTVAEQLLATLADRSLEEALGGALAGVEDNHDVHSVVLPWRAWAALEFTGREHALTLLRQSVRKCAAQAVPKNETAARELTRRRQIVPKLLEQHKLLAKPLGERRAEDHYLDELSATILAATDEQAAAAIAQSLAEGFAPQDLAEAISLASNQLILRQVKDAPGNYGQRTHGDSMGVHASDTTNAWRNMIRVVGDRHRAAGLMLAAANVAQSARWAASLPTSMLHDVPYPHAAQLAAVSTTDSAKLLDELSHAIEANEQLNACAVVQRYGELGYSAEKLFPLLCRYAVSEDGRLHGEKFYRTVREEFASTRASFRWRHLVALARVTASEYGFDAADKRSGRAPGYDEARQLLGLSNAR